MKSILQQINTELLTSFGSEVAKLFNGQLDLANLVINGQELFNAALCEMIGLALTYQDKQISESPFRKQHFRIKDKRSRVLDTSAGSVTYERRYYEEKTTNELIFLLDETVGIEKRSRLSLDLKAALLSDATLMSYRQSAKHNGGPITTSASTVKNIVHSANGAITALDQIGEEIRSVPEILYVEADEDHVAHQDGTNHFLKLVYVHEGYIKNGANKFTLKNPLFVTGEYPTAEGTEELWQTLLDCIEKQYGGKYPKKFFLAGDGAQWIRSGVEYLPNCTLVYDKFHLKKACKKAAIGIGGDLHKTLMGWALQGHSSYLDDYFKIRFNDPDLRSSERSALLESRRLIRRNWKSIQANNMPGFHGCSAEGHVSNLLSIRFSSRPMGWSQKGTDSLSQTRVFVLKDGEVLEKLQERQKVQIKVKVNLRVDNRLRPKYSTQIEKYAAVASAHFVAQANGLTREWQHGITH